MNPTLYLNTHLTPPAPLRFIRGVRVVSTASDLPSGKFIGLAYFSPALKDSPAWWLVTCNIVSDDAHYMVGAWGQYATLADAEAAIEKAYFDSQAAPAPRAPFRFLPKGGR